MKNYRYDVRHNNKISTGLAKYSITNEFNFDEHLKEHILKNYPESNNISTLKAHEDSYIWKLLTSKLFDWLLLLTYELTENFKMSTFPFMLITFKLYCNCAGCVSFALFCWLLLQPFFSRQATSAYKLAFFYIFYFYAFFKHNMKNTDIISKYW